MADKIIPLEKETVCDRMTTPPLGPVELELPNGTAQCHDAASCTLITIEHDNGHKYLVIVSTMPMGGRLIGSLAAFTPDEARNFAASLLHSADLCDGGQQGLN